MTHHELARALLGAFCVMQGAATIALDLNRTHAAHPQWLGHARFHVVWQTATIAAMSALEVGLLYSGNVNDARRFLLVMAMAAAPVFGFFAALITRSLYSGTLSDPGGIPPVMVSVGGRSIRIDMNVVAEVLAVLVLTAFLFLYRAG